MLTSNLNSLPMKKQCKHLVLKLLRIFWISDGSTPSPGLGIRSFGKTCLFVMADVDSLGLFDGVVCWLCDGIDVLLLAGVAVGVILLVSAGTDRGFLTV